jgi:hypothetical protein
MKYRKKPVVIEAVQFSAIAPLPEGVEYDSKGNAIIKTLEGPLRVSDGDWIITGVKGERYPCKPDIFAATYEREDGTPV